MGRIDRAAVKSWDPWRWYVNSLTKLSLDDDFITTFLVFYRKFAAPSKLLQTLVSRFEEASRLAVDYMLQMIAQTRYFLSYANLIPDVVISSLNGYLLTPTISLIPLPMQKPVPSFYLSPKPSALPTTPATSSLSSIISLQTLKTIPTFSGVEQTITLTKRMTKKTLT